jgi:hypothetical protein
MAGKPAEAIGWVEKALRLTPLSRYCWRSPRTVCAYPLALAKAAKEEVRIWAWGVPASHRDRRSGITASRVHDSQSLPALLTQIPAPIGQVSGDGAYDTRACYQAVLQHGATPVFVPRCTARPCATKDLAGWRAARNRVLQQIAARGRTVWRALSGSTRQSIAENTIFRFKRLFGGHLWARGLAT